MPCTLLLVHRSRGFKIYLFIFLFYWYRLCPKICLETGIYISPLPTICRCSLIPIKPFFFLQKKLSFAKHDGNMSAHYSSSSAIFTKTENIPYYSEESNLCSSRDCLLWQMRFMKKFFGKRSQTTLYSLFAFRTSFVVLSVFVIVHK